MSICKLLSFSVAVMFMSAFIAAGTCQAKDKDPGSNSSSTSSNPEITTLQQAYGLLESADHDYHGHRAHAMDAVKQACMVLGADPKGDGKGGEQQGESDTQLRQADQLLIKVKSYAAAQKQTQVVLHVDKAISEISLALARN
jgi:hypothetical protein